MASASWTASSACAPSLPLSQVGIDQVQLAGTATTLGRLERDTMCLYNWLLTYLAAECCRSAASSPPALCLLHAN